MTFKLLAANTRCVVRTHCCNKFFHARTSPFASAPGTIDGDINFSFPPGGPAESITVILFLSTTEYS